MPDRPGVIHSKKSRLRPVPISAVSLLDGFWKQRVDNNHFRGLPRLFEHLEANGVVDNFRIVSGRKSGARKGPYFSDSDLFKWMEGAAWDLQTFDDPDAGSRLDAVIDEVIAAQGDDGYLNTFFQGELYNQRFRNLPLEHELYCAGHLYQAAVAHHRSTGNGRLLEAACRYADYLVSEFGPGKREGVDGHPEVEMALVELYRETGQKRYLDLAGYFLSQLRFTETEALRGHAVRALYACCGGTDYFAEAGDSTFEATLDRLWEDLTAGKVYVTGGVGSRYENEAIGERYELPNTRAYAETCAAIAGMMWNFRLLTLRGDAKYADWMERALYNGVLSGVSLDGISYFYQNPLASYIPYQRQEWFGCTCCPTNMVRTLASIPGYMFAVSQEGVWVHLFASANVRYSLPNGPGFSLEISTDYPWSGNVDIAVKPDTPSEFAVYLRIPGWCCSAACAVNGEELDVGISPGSYLKIRRKWGTSDVIHLNLGMPVTLVECDPRVRENYGSVAVQRGPLIYCAESIDNPGVSIIDLELAAGELSAEFEPGLLGGVVTIHATGLAADTESPRGPLYRPPGQAPRISQKKVPVVLIPYYAWANRGLSHMTVWMPLKG